MDTTETLEYRCLTCEAMHRCEKVRHSCARRGLAPAKCVPGGHIGTCPDCEALIIAHFEKQMKKSRLRLEDDGA